MEVTVYKGEWGDCPHKVISESVHIFTTHVPFGLFGIAYICLLFMIWTYMRYTRARSGHHIYMAQDGAWTLTIHFYL